MSLLTWFLGILGIISFISFFFLMRFKASSKQTDRSDRIKWSSYITYRENSTKKKRKNENSGQDADFGN
jgi:hypothetical protein